MKLATRVTLLTATLAMLAAGSALAQISGEPADRGADAIGTADLHGRVAPPANTAALTTVYTNTASAPNFGFSSTDLTSIWGDELLTTGTGLLSSHQFTVFNSGSSAGTLVSAQVGVSFYDAVTSNFLGGYSTNVTFGPLPQGFYTIVTVPNLDPLNIMLTSTDIVVTQQILSKTGSANRLGIASLNPPTVGSSPNTMYINSSTVGPAGFYNIGNPPMPANPGYQVDLAPPPVPTTHTTWGTIQRLYK